MDILGDAHEIHEAAVPMKVSPSAHHQQAGQEDHTQVGRVNSFLRGVLAWSDKLFTSSAGNSFRWVRASGRHAQIHQG